MKEGKSFLSTSTIRSVRSFHLTGWSPPEESPGPHADRLKHLRFTICPLPDVFPLAITTDYGQSASGGVGYCGARSPGL